MDMRKYSGEHFVKVDDVKDGPIKGQIAVVKEGKWDKPNIVFESGDVLSLNATNISKTPQRMPSGRKAITGSAKWWKCSLA